MRKRHLKKRHRMRKRHISALNREFQTNLGIILSTDNLDSAEMEGMTFYIAEGEVMAMEMEKEPFLTLKGILRHPPIKRYVVVDEGAVPFLYNGADVMSPGIVDADPGIKEGDAVWVKEITHGRPLVVGVALISGPEMVESIKGKAVKTIHYLNDDIWNLEV
ncbi:MAG: RNA-binding protein [Thermoplasmata archaeon]|nr:RNA-binding protein [Thermoplasmata archaeon]